MKRCLRRGMKVTWSANLYVQWAEFRYCLQKLPVYRCLLETTKFTKKKTCETKVSRHSELGCSGSSMTFKRYVI